jgi:hypothetical protein
MFLSRHIILALVLTLAVVSCAPPVCKIKSCHTKQIHMHGGKDFRWVEPWKFWEKQNLRIGEDVPAKTQDRELKVSDKADKATHRNKNENFFVRIFNGLFKKG